MRDLSEQQIRELRAGIAEPPWTACEYMADNPIVSRSDGQTLVMLMWPTHPPEETSRIETEGYATLDFIAAAPEAIDFLLGKLDEATRKGHQLCYLAGSMMLACKQLERLQTKHAALPLPLHCVVGDRCEACRIPLPDLSDEAINKLAEESNAAFAKLDEMREEMPLCSVHKRIDGTSGLKLPVGNNCVACSLNERGELIDILSQSWAEGSLPVDSVTFLRAMLGKQNVLVAREDKARQIAGHHEDTGEGCVLDCLACNDPIAALIRDLNDSRRTGYIDRLAIKGAHEYIAELEAKAEARDKFLAASVAVWRDIDNLAQRAEGYEGVRSSIELRQQEKAAWEEYRAALAQHHGTEEEQ